MESIFKQHRNGLTALAAAVVLAACAFGIAGLGSDDAQAETQQADAVSGDSVFLAESDDSDSQTDDVYEYAAVVIAIAILSIVIGLIWCRKQE